MNEVKVLSSQSMRILEGLAYAKGHQEIDFMEQAGESLARCVEEWMNIRECDRLVTLLIGKGNNGGDAYVAGRKLKERGFTVRAIHLYALEKCGPLCVLQQERFKALGAEVIFLHEEKNIVLPTEGVFLDGLTGTGFKGEAQGLLAELIRKVNHSLLPILSIDIPSGLCGDTGKVGGVAIKASATFYLEFPKIGCFLDQGWDHVGELIPASFGLPKELQEEARPEALLVNRYVCSFPPIQRTRHKYEAGYLLSVAGSESMMGAGALASHAAFKTGCGIVRWYYPSYLTVDPLSDPWEVIKEPFEEGSSFFRELERASAVLIGPGIGREKEGQKWIKKILARLTKPCLLDADALFFLAKNPSFSLPSSSVLTPHRGELARLLEGAGLLNSSWLKACSELSDRFQTVLLAKGAPHFLFAPQQVPKILPWGDPLMATAGMGDVLAGMIASFLSQGFSPLEAACVGCYLHSSAALLAIKENHGFSLMASDVIAQIPRAAFPFLKRDRIK